MTEPVSTAGRSADATTGQQHTNGGTDYRERFVEQLRGLASRNDRAALATLRRGLNNNPDTLIACLAYVLPLLPPNLSLLQQDDCIRVAALFSLYPDAPRQGFGAGRVTNFGATLRAIRDATKSSTLELRFKALLNTDSQNLGVPLRSAIQLAKTHQIPVDWVQLLRDLGAWEWSSRRVQRAWSQAFWPSAASGGADE